MHKKVVKYSIIFFVLMIYINRCFFIAPYEIKNQGNKETNSVVEWVLQLVTGENNDFDEDGDVQTNYNFTQIFLHEFTLQLNNFSKEIEKNRFPSKESFLFKDFYFQIDKPPEV